jgi:hypothetical protein
MSGAVTNCRALAQLVNPGTAAPGASAGDYTVFEAFTMVRPYAGWRPLGGGSPGTVLVAEGDGRGLKPVALGHDPRRLRRQRRPRLRRRVDPGRQLGVPGR